MLNYELLNELRKGAEHKKRVAAYCRVSTDKEDQANSFESQQRYFKAYIEREPDWELKEVYAEIYGCTIVAHISLSFGNLS